MSKLPFGLKAPSKGTVIFVSIVSAITGTAYASKYYADEARKAHCNKVSFLADRPCGVHVCMPSLSYRILEVYRFLYRKCLEK